MTLLANVILEPDVAASRPAAADVPIGALYFATDTAVVSRNNGTTWDDYGPTAVLPDPSGATDGQVLQILTGAYVIDDAPGGGGAGYLGYINLQDQKSAGTGGGTFTSGSYQTRVLNTEVDDTNSDCSLASNQITLDAGTYECFITCPAQRVDRHKARLYNTTDSSVVLLGTLGNSPSSSSSGQFEVLNLIDISMIRGRFTIGASKALEVQHKCLTTGIYGDAATFDTEVYTVAEFWRVS